MPRARINTLLEMDGNLRNAIIKSGKQKRSVISYTVGTGSRTELRVRRNSRVTRGPKIGYHNLKNMQWKKVDQSSSSASSPRSGAFFAAESMGGTEPAPMTASLAQSHPSGQSSQQPASVMSIADPTVGS